MCLRQTFSRRGKGNKQVSKQNQRRECVLCTGHRAPAAVLVHQRWCCWSSQQSSHQVCVKAGLQSAFPAYAGPSSGAAVRCTLFQSFCQTRWKRREERHLHLEEAMCPTAGGKSLLSEHPYWEHHKRLDPCSTWVIPIHLFRRLPMCHLLQEAILDSTKDRLICPSSMCQAALLITLQWNLPLCKVNLGLFICLLH